MSNQLSISNRNIFFPPGFSNVGFRILTKETCSINVRGMKFRIQNKDRKQT